MNKISYDRRVAFLRAYIEDDGICNALGALINAIELERDNFNEESTNYKNYNHSIEILDLVKSALDINYSNQNKNLLTEGIDKLINDLSDLK